MSGIYQNWSASAPGGLDESTAAVASGIAEAMSATAVNQSEAHAMFVQHGAAVITHSVGEPGRAGDPDPSLDAADQ